MNKITWLLSILVLVLVMACGGNNATSNAEQLPGKIAIANTGIELAKVAASGTVSGVDIHFGTAKQSIQRFLEMVNVGGAPITDLTITTSDRAYSVSPGYIAELETEGNASLRQILELDIVHGTSISGNVPIEPLLNYGLNKFSVYFDGTTLGKPFHTEFVFSVNAIYVNATHGNGDKLYYSGDSKGTIPAFVQKEASFVDESCNIWSNEKRLSVGDTIPNAFNIKWGDMVGDSIPYQYFVAEKEWKTDCVIKQSLPVDLQ